jgi:hypothetical protein
MKTVPIDRPTVGKDNNLFHTNFIRALKATAETANGIFQSTFSVGQSKLILSIERCEIARTSAITIQNRT